MSQRPKCTIVIMHCPSCVPLFIVNHLSVNNLHSWLINDGFWWNLVGMKSWSLTSVVVFQPHPPADKSRTVGATSLTNFFFITEGFRNKLNTQHWSRSMWEEVLFIFILNDTMLLYRFWVHLEFTRIIRHFIKLRKRGALMHVYVWEHTSSHFSRTVWWIWQ